MAKLLPDTKLWTRTGITLPNTLLESLERVRAQANKERQGPDRLSRDELVCHALEWFVREWDAQQKAGKK